MAEAKISIPAFEKKVTLQTLQGQKVMRRSYERTANSLYRIDVILRIIGDEDNAARVEAVIDSMIKEIEEAMHKDMSARGAEIENHGIDELPGYNAPVHHTVQITSPHVSRYLHLVLQVDSLVQHIDALWLSGALTNKERNDAVYAWQQKVIGLGSRIIGLERRARQAARRQGKEDEVEEAAPRESAEKAPETKAESEPAKEAAPA